MVRYAFMQVCLSRTHGARKAIQDARTQAGETAEALGAGLGPIYSVDNVGAQNSFGYNAETLDKVTVTGSASGRYVQPTVEYRASVRAVFELKR